jgi:hypothetical protein
MLTVFHYDENISEKIGDGNVQNHYYSYLTAQMVCKIALTKFILIICRKLCTICKIRNEVSVTEIT